MVEKITDRVLCVLKHSDDTTVVRGSGGGAACGDRCSDGHRDWERSRGRGGRRGRRRGAVMKQVLDRVLRFFEHAHNSSMVRGSRRAAACSDGSSDGHRDWVRSRGWGGRWGGRRGAVMKQISDRVLCILKHSDDAAMVRGSRRAAACSDRSSTRGLRR